MRFQLPRRILTERRRRLESCEPVAPDPSREKSRRRGSSSDSSASAPESTTESSTSSSSSVDSRERDLSCLDPQTQFVTLPPPPPLATLDSASKSLSVTNRDTAPPGGTSNDDQNAWWRRLWRSAHDRWSRVTRTPDYQYQGRASGGGGGFWLTMKPEWWFRVRRYFFLISMMCRMLCTAVLIGLCVVVGTLHIPILSTLESIERIVVPEFKSVLYVRSDTRSTSTIPFGAGSVVSRLPSGELSQDGFFHVEVSTIDDIFFNDTSFDATPFSWTSSSTPTVCEREVADAVVAELVSIGVSAAINVTQSVHNTAAAGLAEVVVSCSGVLAVPLMRHIPVPPNASSTTVAGWLVGCRCSLRTAVTGFTYIPGSKSASMQTAPASLRFLDERVSLSVVASLSDNASLSRNSSVWIPIDNVLTAQVVPWAHYGRKETNSSAATWEVTVLGTNRSMGSCVRCTAESEEVVAVQVRIILDDGGRGTSPFADSQWRPSRVVSFTAVGTSNSADAATTPRPHLWATWTTAALALLPRNASDAVVVGNDGTTEDNCTIARFQNFSVLVGFAVLSSSDGDTAVCAIFTTETPSCWNNSRLDGDTILSLPPLQPSVVVLVHLERGISSVCGAPLQVVFASASVAAPSAGEANWEVALLLANLHDNIRCLESNSLFPHDPAYTGPGALGADPVSDVIGEGRFSRSLSFARFSIADNVMSTVMPLSTTSLSLSSRVALEALILSALPGEPIRNESATVIRFGALPGVNSSSMVVNWLMEVVSVDGGAVSRYGIQWRGGFEIAGVCLALSAVTGSDDVPSDAVSLLMSLAVPSSGTAFAPLQTLDVGVGGRIPVWTVLDAAVWPMIPAIAPYYPSLSWSLLTSYVTWTLEETTVIRRLLNTAAVRRMELCMGPSSRGIFLRPPSSSRSSLCFARVVSTQQLQLLTNS